MQRLGVAAVLTTLMGMGPGSLLAQSAAQLAPQVREQYVAVAEPVVALTHVRVIDGTGAAPQEDQTVLIDNGRIRAVGPAATVPVPAAARVMELRGKTVIPGLFGMHNHTFYPAGGAGGQRNHHWHSAPRLYLGSGVTSIRTAGTYEPYQDLNLRDQIERGQVPGPRMNVSGAYIDANRGRVDGVEDARRLVAYWADEGATNFKVYTQVTRAELAAAIQEAHRRGLKITGHLCSIGYREAAALGIDNIEHSYQVNTEWYPNKRPDECPRASRLDLADLDINGEQVQATLRDLIRHNVAVTVTYAVHECPIPGRPPLQQRFLDALNELTRASVLARRSRAGVDSARQARLFRRGMEFDRAFVKAGGHLQAGLDPTGGGCSLFGFGDQRNVQLLVEAGFTPVDAIKIASYNGATFLGQADSLGSIAAGKVADLVVLDGNPAANIGDVEKVTLVFKGGVGYDSAKLIAAVKGQVGVN
ncbi:MAG: amidohydrolase family protein [Gemmatimonadetes bacterium]|nr:amidohydrolase family protein [Gemmatimonadota bacterium]